MLVPGGLHALPIVLSRLKGQSLHGPLVIQMLYKAYRSLASYLAFGLCDFRVPLSSRSRPFLSAVGNCYQVDRLLWTDYRNIVASIESRALAGAGSSLSFAYSLGPG